MKFENYQSALKLESLIFSRLEFSRSYDEVDYDNFDFNIEKIINTLEPVEEIAADNKQNLFEVKLVFTISTKNESFNCLIEASGLFSMPNKITDATTTHLIEKNTIAIMFPYLRTQLTLLTSQPGMQPIVIPTVNINKLFDDID